jgi:hypothetical protein
VEQFPPNLKLRFPDSKQGLKWCRPKFSCPTHARPIYGRQSQQPTASEWNSLRDEHSALPLQVQNVNHVWMSIMSLSPTVLDGTQEGCELVLTPLCFLKIRFVNCRGSTTLLRVSSKLNESLVADANKMF